VRARGGRTRPGPSGRLLERERELEALAAAVGAAADGTPGLVLVEGPAGIGKSRLLAAARTLADERGVGVLAARGGQLEREFPFGIVRQLFESLLSDDSARSHLAQALSEIAPESS
jgi:predicted ATPase